MPAAITCSTVRLISVSSARSHRGNAATDQQDRHFTKAGAAKEHGIPRFIGGGSTIDLKCATGASIPIEERDRRSPLHRRGITPKGARARQPGGV